MFRGPRAPSAELSPFADRLSRSWPAFLFAAAVGAVCFIAPAAGASAEDQNANASLGPLLAQIAPYPAGPSAKDQNASAEDQKKWFTSLGASYYTGKFGTTQRTDILYVPLSIRRTLLDGKADVTVVVPYVSIRSAGGVTLLSGQANRTGSVTPSSSGGGGASPSMGMGRGRGASVRGSERLSTTGAGVPRITESGLGDIIVRGRYFLDLDEVGRLPTVVLYSRSKIPTANRNQGLGTGKFDQGFGTGLIQRFGERWIGYADVWYTYIGKPSGIKLNNQYAYDVGGGYSFTPNLLGTLFYEERENLVPGLPHPRDLLFYLSWKAFPNMLLAGAGEVGLSRGAPTYGVTGAIMFRF